MRLGAVEEEGEERTGRLALEELGDELAADLARRSGFAAICGRSSARQYQESE